MNVPEIDITGTSALSREQAAAVIDALDAASDQDISTFVTLGGKRIAIIVPVADVTSECLTCDGMTWRATGLHVDTERCPGPKRDPEIIALAKAAYEFQCRETLGALGSAWPPWERVQLRTREHWIATVSMIREQLRSSAT